jgi:hypothetical protein
MLPSLQLKRIPPSQFGHRCYVQISVLNEVLDIPYVIILFPTCKS